MVASSPSSCPLALHSRSAVLTGAALLISLCLTQKLLQSPSSRASRLPRSFPPRHSFLAPNLQAKLKDQRWLLLVLVPVLTRLLLLQVLVLELMLVPVLLWAEKLMPWAS